MSFPGYPVQLNYTPLVITAAQTPTQVNDVIEVNKTTAGPTSVVLPQMTVDHVYQVVDAKGDAATNNITITTTQGDGKIDAATSAVINQANESLSFIYDGTTTKIV